MNGANITQARNGVGNPPWAAQYLNMPTYNGHMEWTVPRTATYRIVAQGSGGNSDNMFGYTGGQGARMQGDFTLTQGEIVTMAIGHRGASGSGGQGCNHNVSGGNGATWVLRGNKYTNAVQSDVMVIAGAGGTPGTYPCCNNSNYAVNANTGTGGNWNNAYGGIAADGGNGAGTRSGHGTGGAGFFSDGSGNWTNWGPSAYKNANNPLRGGYMYTPWGDTGRHGGFGGGGSSGLHSGGSGGWSGGGGGEWCSYLQGGGGGSLNNGANQVNNIQGGNTDGFVIITQL
jgi:hypothetical protein